MLDHESEERKDVKEEEMEEERNGGMTDEMIDEMENGRNEVDMEVDGEIDGMIVDTEDEMTVLDTVEEMTVMIDEEDMREEMTMEGLIVVMIANNDRLKERMNEKHVRLTVGRNVVEDLTEEMNGLVPLNEEMTDNRIDKKEEVVTEVVGVIGMIIGDTPSGEDKREEDHNNTNMTILIGKTFGRVRRSRSRSRERNNRDRHR